MRIVHAIANNFYAYATLISFPFPIKILKTKIIKNFDSRYAAESISCEAVTI